MCLRPSEGVEVMWELLGDLDSGEMNWERLW